MEPFSLHDAVANDEMIFQCGCFPFLSRTRKKTATTMKTATHEFVDHQRLLGIVRLESG